MFKAVSVRDRDRISDCDGELSSSQSAPVTPEEPPAPRRSIRSVRYPGEVYPPPEPPIPPEPPTPVENGLLLAPGVFLENEDGQGNILPEDGGTILIGSLAETTSVDPTTPSYVVNDPGGAAASKSVTLQNILDGMTQLATGYPDAESDALMWLVQADTARSVTIAQLYAYLELIGGLFPDGQIARTVGAGPGSTNLADGPGGWIVYGTFQAVDPTATTDARIRRVGGAVPAGPISYAGWRLNQFPRFRCVAATNRDAGAIIPNRFSIGLSQNATTLGIIDSDTPTDPSLCFWCPSTQDTWHIRIYDGLSETHSFDTGIPVDSPTPRKFDIVVSPGPTVRFYIDDINHYTTSIDLPDFDIGLQAHALSGREGLYSIEIVLVDVTPTTW